MSEKHTETIVIGMQINTAMFLKYLLSKKTATGNTTAVRALSHLNTANSRNELFFASS